MPIRVYSYAKCSTCRDALRFLKNQHIAHDVVDILESPPSASELRQALGFFSGERRRLFNTSGQQYRELGLADKLPAMTDTEAIALLAKNGKLIKRPFVVFNDGEKAHFLLGFKQDEWNQTLKKS